MLIWRSCILKLSCEPLMRNWIESLAAVPERQTKCSLPLRRAASRQPPCLSIWMTTGIVSPFCWGRVAQYRPAAVLDMLSRWDLPQQCQSLVRNLPLFVNTNQDTICDKYLEMETTAVRLSTEVLSLFNGGRAECHSAVLLLH